MKARGLYRIVIKPKVAGVLIFAYDNNKTWVFIGVFHMLYAVFYSVDPKRTFLLFSTH